MPRFHYKARDSRGRALEGFLEGPSSGVVADELSANGMVPLDIIEHSGAKSSSRWERFVEQLNTRAPGLDDLILFTRQNYALTKAGVPINRGLRQLADSSPNRYFAEILGDIQEDLESGRELAGALARHVQVFPPLFVNMIRVGEQSGHLEEAFHRLYEYLEREKSTREKIKGALRYPAMVLGAIAIAIAVLTMFVIPAFADVYSQFELQLPWATRFILAVSGFASAYWYLIVLGAVGAVFGVRA